MFEELLIFNPNAREPLIFTDDLDEIDGLALFSN